LNNRFGKTVSKIQDIYNQLESLGEPFDATSIKNKFLGRVMKEDYWRFLILLCKMLKTN